MHGISPLSLLLVSSFLFLMLTSIVFIRNRFDLKPLPASATKSELSISVCIPARNEEANIGLLLHSLLKQDLERVTVHVLDDQSEDSTPAILNEKAPDFEGKLQIHTSRERPTGWLGKPWACNQLGQAAEGDLLIFLDADTELQPGALHRLATAFELYESDMLTVWPKQILGTFWENVVIPLIYHALLTLLPVIYVHRKPRWLPSFLNSVVGDKFAAANGQCLAFTAESYRKLGGHRAVKDKIVEDVEFAKKAKREGFSVRMFEGSQTVSCRMYRNQSEMFGGLRKNFLAGFNNSIPLFLIMALLHLVVYILPFFVLIYAFAAGRADLLFLSTGSITLILLQRLLLANWFGWNPLYAFAHPIGVFWFQWLGIVKLVDFFSGKKVNWKGREV